MRRIRGWWVLAHLSTLGCLAASPDLAVAQHTTGQSPALSLEDALRLAMSGNPSVNAALLGVEAADGRVQQAGARPNPEFGVELENFSGDLAGASESETSFQLSKRLELGGKRSARLAVADADRTLAEQGLDVALLDLVRDVRVDFAQGLAAQQQLRLAEETLAIAREVAVAVQAKVEAGGLPVVEATRSRVAISAAEIDSQRARGIAQLARERLALHWGGQPVPVGLDGNLDSLAVLPGIEELIARLPENPDLSRWTRQGDLQRARLRLQESLKNLDLELGGGYRYLASDDRGTFLLGISAALPLLDRNRGAIREATAELERSSMEQEQVRRALERNLREEVARLQIAQAEVRGLRQSVLPGAQAVYEGIWQGYEQGRFTYLDVLEARRALAQAGEAEITALSALEQSRIEIERLVGQGKNLIDRVQEETR